MAIKNQPIKYSIKTWLITMLLGSIGLTFILLDFYVSKLSDFVTPFSVVFGFACILAFPALVLMIVLNQFLFPKFSIANIKIANSIMGLFMICCVLVTISHANLLNDIYLTSPYCLVGLISCWLFKIKDTNK